MNTTVDMFVLIQIKNLHSAKFSPLFSLVSSKLLPKKQTSTKHNDNVTL